MKTLATEASCIIIFTGIVVARILYAMTAICMGTNKPAPLNEKLFIKLILICVNCKQVDKKVIAAIAKETDRQKFPLVKYYCKTVTAKNTINFTDGKYM